MNIDGIIFDLDGTLWNSTEVVLKAWNYVLKNRSEVKKPITKDQLAKAMGLQLPEIGEMFFPYLEENKRMDIMNSCCNLECDFIRKEGGKVYRDLEETLDILSQKYPLFIVSNCQSGYIEAFLSYHKLQYYFEDIECAGNTRLHKGENIKLIMERNRVKNAIYVGDTKGDYDAAKIAEVPFVYAAYGFGKVSDYDYKINDIKDLLKIADMEIVSA